MSRTSDGTELVAVVNPDGSNVLSGIGSSSSQTQNAYSPATALQSAVAATGNGTSFTVAGFNTLELEVTGTFVGTVTFEGQTAAGSWVAINGKPVGGFALATSTTTTGSWKFDVDGLLAFRARVSAYTSGSITATVVATSGHNHAGVQNSTLATVLDKTNDSITNYPVSNSSTYISTATTTTSKSGAGHLARIIIGETAAGAITVYDNTAGSGTVLAVFKASIAEGTYEFNIAFSTGLTIVTAGASKLTVVWR